jgi:hypothetical protein
MTYPSPSGHIAGPHSSRGDFIDELNDAIRQNPVPAVLIGAGLLWMFMGGARNTVLGGASWSLFSGIAQGAQHTGATAYRGAREVGAKVAEGAGVIAETAGEAGSQAAGAMRSAAGALGGAASETTSQATQIAKGAYDVAEDMIEPAASSISRQGLESYKGLQQALAEMFDKQPLLLGAVGVAVGAAIAASLPATNVENRLVGDTADSLKDKAQELWSETTERAEAMAAKGLAEAKAQGLTPEAAGEALREVTDKVVDVAEVAKKSVRRQIKGQGPSPSGPSSSLGEQPANHKL